VTVTAPARLPGAPLPLSQVPASVQTIPGDAIRGSGAASLQDVLTRLPGVTLNDEQGNRVQPDLSLRGFQATPVTGVPQGLSVFVDGVRVNEPDVEEVNFDLLPLDDIERVELVRGPSAIFGRNTLGGALNIITRGGGERRELVPELETGSFGRQKYRLTMSGPAAPLDYYLSGTLFLEDGWRDRSAVRLGKLFGKLGLTAADTSVTLSFQRADNRIEQPGSLPESERARHPRLNYTGGDFFQPVSNLGTLTVKQQLGERTLLTLTAFGRTLDAEQFNVNQLTDNTRSFNDTVSAGATVQLDHDARPAGHANRFTAGAEYTYHDVGVTVFTEPHGGGRDLDSKVRDHQHGAAVYIQDTLELARDLLRQGDMLTLTAGARWDWLRHDIDNLAPSEEPSPSATGVSTFQRLSPRLGVNYSPGAAATVYFVFAQGFRAPAFLELTCASASAACPGLQAGVAPDPPLQAVKANHYELGARLQPLPWLGLDVSLFRTDVRDDIYSVSPTGTTAVFFQNVGDTRRQGAEVSGRASLNARWDLRLSYTYTEATFRNDLQLATPRLTAGCASLPCQEEVASGSDLPLVPRHKIQAGIEHRLTSWLTLWLSGSFVGTQRLRGDEANEERPLASYVVLNAGARVNWRDLTAFVGIHNLTDASYETFGTFAPNARQPGAPVERFVTPAPPINVTAGLGYRF